MVIASGTPVTTAIENIDERASGTPRTGVRFRSVFGRAGNLAVTAAVLCLCVDRVGGRQPAHQQQDYGTYLSDKISQHRNLFALGKIHYARSKFQTSRFMQPNGQLCVTARSTIKIPTRNIGRD